MMGSRSFGWFSLQHLGFGYGGRCAGYAFAFNNAAGLGAALGGALGGLLDRVLAVAAPCSAMGAVVVMHAVEVEGISHGTSAFHSLGTH